MDSGSQAERCRPHPHSSSTVAAKMASGKQQMAYGLPEAAMHQRWLRQICPGGTRSTR